MSDDEQGYAPAVYLEPVEESNTDKDVYPENNTDEGMLHQREREREREREKEREREREGERETEREREREGERDRRIA